MNPAMPQPAYPPLTCLVCGEFQGRHTVAPLTRGWVQSGGFPGIVNSCDCCSGRGWHAPEDGVPDCQTIGEDLHRRTYLADHDYDQPLEWDVRLRIKATEAAIRCWDREREARAYAALAPVYGAEEAARLMGEEPPL